MKLETCLNLIIRPTTVWLGASYAAAEAEVMLLTIAQQESGLTARKQFRGPANGLWQFEMGGIRGVLNHPASRSTAQAVCADLLVPAKEADVYMALPYCDALACAFARLLLFTDAAPLPALGDVQGAWGYYRRNWRPGAPKSDAWPARYAAALKLVQPI